MVEVCDGGGSVVVEDLWWSVVIMAGLRWRVGDSRVLVVTECL